MIIGNIVTSVTLMQPIFDCIKCDINTDIHQRTMYRVYSVHWTNTAVFYGSTQDAHSNLLYSRMHTECIIGTTASIRIVFRSLTSRPSKGSRSCPLIWSKCTGPVDQLGGTVSGITGTVHKNSVNWAIRKCAYKQNSGTSSGTRVIEKPH